MLSPSCWRGRLSVTMLAQCFGVRVSTRVCVQRAALSSDNSCSAKYVNIFLISP